MRVVVLGGGGFLGSHVTRWLTARGHRVRVFDLHAPKWPAAAKVEVVEGNFLNPSDVDAALQGGVDAVLHFISMTVPASSIDNVPVEIESNVAATVRLLDLMARRDIRKIGFPSSGGTVYSPSAAPHREDEPPRATCPYGLGKLLVEEVLGFYRDHKGIDFQIWRIANPYGDAAARLHTAQGAIDAFLHRIQAGKPIRIWGDGTAVRDFVFADDVAGAIGLLLEKNVWGEVVNIGTGQGESIAEAIELIRAVADRPVVVERIEAYTGPSTAVLDSSKLRRLTGWAPAFDLAGGIREAWRRLNAP